MYRINKWSETFENADSRKRQRLGWFMCPSGNDSGGYLELMSRGADGIAAYGVFIAICQWSATRGKQQRGEVSRNDGRPMSVELLATTIRMPLDVVAKSLPVLCHPDVGWITNENTTKTAVATVTETGVPEKRASAVPSTCQSHPENSPIVKGEGEGEGKGKGKGKAYLPGPDVFISKKINTPEVIEAVGRWAAWRNSQDENSIETNSPQEEETFRIIAGWDCSAAEIVQAISAAIAAKWRRLYPPESAASGNASALDDVWPAVVAKLVSMDLGMPYSKELQVAFGDKVLAAVKSIGAQKIVQSNEYQLSQLAKQFRKEVA